MTIFLRQIIVLVHQDQQIIHNLVALAEWSAELKHEILIEAKVIQKSW